jgi:hypothetical protein
LSIVTGLAAASYVKMTAVVVQEDMMPVSRRGRVWHEGHRRRAGVHGWQARLEGQQGDSFAPVEPEHGRSAASGGGLPALGFGYGPGGVDEPDVAEGLGEVAEQFTGGRVDFLGEQVDVVEVGDGTFEDVP